MTTKVIISCPDTSHNDVKVTIEDRVYDAATKQNTDDWVVFREVILKPTESVETYLYDSRRMSVVEVASI